MPDRPTALTAAAGEHYVCYELSVRSCIAALTRGGSPSVDILVSNQAGTKTIGIQVKTSNWAFRNRKKKPETSHGEFDVGQKAVGKKDNSFLYAFVNLYGENQVKPLVFIVPPSEVAAALGDGYSRNMFWIFPKDREKYETENWKLIAKILDE
jgi:hypothetical protein